MIDAAALRARLADVRARIARAAGRAGRDPSSVRLIAVSKTFPAEFVRAAADAGQVDFGENKVQEALLKMDQTSDLAVRWHLIGHLQSNKAKKAARFDVVQSVDGAALVEKLDEAAGAAGRTLDLLVQVDLAGEATKYGAREEALAAKLDEAAGAAGRTLDLLVQVDLAGEATKYGAREEALTAIFDAARSTRFCRCAGLMTLPPAVDDPEAARPYFRALRDVRDRLLARGVDASMLRELSMGMSHDFEVAIEEGATLVRVGTAIFGGRQRGQTPAGV